MFCLLYNICTMNWLPTYAYIEVSQTQYQKQFYIKRVILHSKDRSLYSCTPKKQQVKMQSSNSPANRSAFELMKSMQWIQVLLQAHSRVIPSQPYVTHTTGGTEIRLLNQLLLECNNSVTQVGKVCHTSWKVVLHSVMHRGLLGITYSSRFYSCIKGGNGWLISFMLVFTIVYLHTRELLNRSKSSGWVHCSYR